MANQKIGTGQGSEKNSDTEKRLPDNAGGNSRGGKGGSHPSGDTPGSVTDPDTDGRLKQKRDQSASKSGDNKRADDDEDDRGSRSSKDSSEPERDEDGKFAKGGGSQNSDRKQSAGHTPGAVTDPEHDGRLKQNR